MGFLKKILLPSILYIIGVFLIFLYYYLNKNIIILDLYISMLICFFYCTYLLLEFYFYKKYRTIVKKQVLKKQINEKMFFYKEEIMDIKKVSEDNQKIINRYISDSNKERRLLSGFVHNIKTPVSSINLLCERVETNEIEFLEAIKEIKIQNDRILSDLNHILDFKRIDEFDKDYCPELLNVRVVIEELINENKRLFILHNVYPKTDLKDLEIVTDKKWVKEMLKQVLSNAIKYSKHNGIIYFNATCDDKYVYLEIKDEGIGIKEYDMNRIFDPFFTGENGRLSKFSSGIGLYLVKLIADKLSISIDVKSVEQKGTSFTFTFLQNCKN